jgi:lipopolysaccharide/colanic/teichoic acid biosynthesis glycosyltransferase
MIGIGRIARWWRGENRGQAAGTSGFLLAAAELRRLLERERMRSDRSGAVFSLLVLTDPPEMQTLADALERRLRATDMAGYMRRYQIGVFLPDTPCDGAWKLAEDILAMLPPHLPLPHCQVYVYPDAWSQRDEDRDQEIESAPAIGHPLHETRAHNGHAHTGRNHEGIHGGEHTHRRHLDHGHVSHFHCEPESSHSLQDGNSATATLERPHTRRKRAAPSQPLDFLLAQPLPWWKRAIDIGGAIVGLTLLSPLLLVVGALVKLTSPGPVLFIQPREGLGGRRFRMLKFRTMIDGAASLQNSLMGQNEQDGPAFKIADDPRITRVGKKLRDWNIDELPQLWNVLRGEMSLVGPRPLPVGESLACENWQRRRLDVTPGMTCLWQVLDRRNTISFPEWMRLDLQYAKRRTLAGDIRLLWATFYSMFVRRFFKNK